ncbi:calpain, small subunit 1 L homeolog [Xenopus laevis]|nr:calpain, small subunit 1 L homeolog [Xenopus laevis]AAH82462.1 MGC84330 protein [Xenopus laevis]
MGFNPASGQGGGGGGQGGVGNILKGAIGSIASAQGGGGGQGGVGNILKGAIGSIASGQGGASGGQGGVGNIIGGAISSIAGGQGGGAGKFLQGAIGSLAGGGSGQGGAGKLFAGAGGGGGGQGILGGILNVIGEVIANYKPAPPPVPVANVYQQEANENDEQRQFRRLFKQLAGEDMEVNADELKNVLDKVVAKHQDLKTSGFSIDTCRSMVAIMDSDGTGKLGFEEFKYLWNNIKKWQCIYKQFDTERSGYINCQALPGALKAAGFDLHDQLHVLLARRYADESGNINFDSFISALVRLDAMYRAFKALDRENTGQVQVRMPEWLKLTIYS